MSADMKKVTVATSNKYDVLIGDGLLNKAGDLIANVLTRRKLCVVSDAAVYGLYGKSAAASLSGAGFTVCPFIFDPGEQSKNMDTLSGLLGYMAGERLSRSDAVVALGGGVTGDLAGFAASCYLRGVPFVQMPTTLLAAVDSSVGGKTGVNLEGGKNLAGAFWQPSLVICDCRLCASLPKDTLLDGIAEIIKYGVIADRELFDLILSNDIFTLFENDLLERIIEKCVTIKSDIVSGDEHDTGKRQLLNFGHTIGHAIEKCSGYKIPHGHAVAIGMLYISRAAERSGLSRPGCADEIERVLRHYGFTPDCGYSADEIYEAALVDKKRAGGYITLVIPDVIGKCRLEKLDIKLFREFVGKGF